MKTTIDGVEITSDVIEVLKEWYNKDCYEIKLEHYIGWMRKIQDYLTRIWTDMDRGDDTSEIKECVSCLLIIKDDLERFMPENNVTD